MSVEVASRSVPPATEVPMRSPALFCTIAVLSLACGTKSEGTGTSPGDTGTSSSSGGEGDEDPDPSNTGGNTTTAATSASTTVSTTEPMDTGADESGFIKPPDGGQVEPMCDLAMQDCPRGQKCTSYVSMPGGETVDNTHCVDVNGDKQFGEECTRVEGNDDCAAGFFCMTDVSGHTGMGICLEYCAVGQPCVNGGECFSFNDGALPLCELLCNPLIQDCPGDQGCYGFMTSNFVCATPAENAGADNDPCGVIQGCEPGLLCKTGGSGCAADTACCTPVCDLNGDASQCDAAGGEMCVQALDDPPPGLEDVGYCTIPA